MAEGTDPNFIEEERLRNELGKSLLEILKQQSKARGDFNQETKQSTDLAKELSRYTRDDIVNARKREKFQRSYNKAIKEQQVLEGKIRDLLESVGGIQSNLNEQQAERLKDLQEALEVSRETTQEAKILTREYKLLDRIAGTFDLFGKAVDDIPIIREIFREFTNASTKAAEVQRDTGDAVQAFAAGSKEFTKGAAKAGITGILLQLISGTKILEDFGNNLVNILQIPQSDAGDLKRAFGDLSNTLGAFDVDDVTRGIQSMSQQLGSATVQSSDFIKTFLTLTDRLGISEEATANIARFAASTGDSFSGVTSEVVGLVGGLNDANDLNLRFADILNDIGNASEATVLTVQKFPDGIAKAAFQARKFGLTLSQLENTSSSLLDFQSSIESELQAELLTGRSLNLERARMAALMGDQATLAKEVADNVGTSEDFAKLNVIQQEALAKAFGMSRQELAKTLMQREALVELEKTSRVEGLAGMKQEEQIAALTAKYQKEGLDAASARSRALREIGKEELDRQEKALAFQDELSKTFKDLTVSIGKLTDALDVDLMGGLIDALEGFTATVENIRTKGFFNTVFSSMIDDDIFDEEGNVLNPGEYSKKRKGKKEGSFDDFTIRANPKDTLVMAGGTKLGDETNTLLKELITAVKSGGHVYIDGRKVGETLALNYTAIG